MHPLYEKFDYETDYEYGLRLIETKVEEKPEDLDWQDIVEALGLDCHRDSLRKAASVTPYSGYEVAQYYKRKAAEHALSGASASYADELDTKAMNLRIEAQKYSDQRREFNKLLAKLGRTENISDCLADAAQKLNEQYPLLRSNAVPPYLDDEAVIVLSDWHYGMVTNNVWEVYNVETCKDRVSQLVTSIIRRLHIHCCKSAHIVLLGDMAHGAIHVSSRVASEELVCDQIMNVSEILAQFISSVAEYVEETHVYSTYGNHLRTVQKKDDSIHADNMERIIPWWLQQRLSGRCDIKFHDSSYHEFLYFSVCGYNICATHGDLDSVKNSGRLFSSIFNKKYNLPVDYVLLADKHHNESFDELGISSMIVGSLCGTDEYANGKRLYSTPSQTMLIFNPDCGRDAIYQIEFK